MFRTTDATDNVRTIPVGPLQCNMTIVAHPTTKHAVGFAYYILFVFLFFT